MARYFFNVQNGNDTYIDEIGDDLPDDHAAWSEATRSAGESLRDLDGRLQPGKEWRMEVMAEERGLLYVIEVKAHVRGATAASVNSPEQPPAGHRSRK
jgi:hypothetical protein